METDALTTYGVRPPGTKDAVVWQKVILCHLLKHHTPREHREECLHFFHAENLSWICRHKEVKRPRKLKKTKGFLHAVIVVMEVKGYSQSH